MPESPTPAKKSLIKKLIKPGIALVVIVGGAAAFYFGYWMNPSVIYGQSLKDTGTVYSKLISYVDTQSKVTYKGAKISGDLNYVTGGATITGNLTEQSSGTNSTASFTTSFAGKKIDFEARSVTASGQKTPDVYIQLTGVKDLGLADSLGVSPEQVAAVDGKWIVIDHTVIDALKTQIQAQLTANGSANKPSLSKTDIISAAKDFGTVNNQYVFTSNKSKSVTKVIKNIGFETINGHKTYHYKVGFVKANVKSYITAIRDSLQKDSLGKWATAQTGQSVNDLIGYNDLEKSADNIKATDTIDVWSDTSSRIIYKVRVSDPTNAATNYVDVGLDYKNSDSLPFFMNFVDNTDSTNKTAVNVLATINPKANSLAGKISFNATDSTDSTNNTSLVANLSVQPTNDALNLTAPTGAVSLKDALNALGMGDLYDQILSGAASGGSAVTGGTANPSASALGSIVQSL